MMDRLHLIAEIFSRPRLWDLESEEYKTRTGISELWKEVAASMGPDVTIDECKRKWKNLRDAYRAEIKRIELRIERDILKNTYDPKNRYGSKWAYFEHMKFIKDIKRPRRSIFEVNLTATSNDIYKDDDDLEQFSKFHNINSIKLEPDAEKDAQIYSRVDEDDSTNTQMYSEELLNEAEKQQQDQARNTLLRIPAIKLNLLAQNSCKCPKRSYDQMHSFEDLEKQEQTLIRSTRFNTRSHDFAQVGDSDYNFLVSFLPQLRKMSELQNLQFRAKIADFMFKIMFQSVTNNGCCVVAD